VSYYGKTIPTPVAGEEPQFQQRPTSPTFSDEEAQLRPGETAIEYADRLAALVSLREESDEG
jgi:hypothetical protein